MQHQQEENKKSIPVLLGKTNQDKYSKPSVIRPSDNYTFYGTTKTKRGEAEISLALKLILEDGEQLIIQYHEMVSPMRYNGADEIKIATPTLSIVITGKNLDSIIDYLAEHRLVWIKEPDSSFVKVGQDEPEIEAIKLAEK